MCNEASKELLRHKTLQWMIWEKYRIKKISHYATLARMWSVSSWRWWEVTDLETVKSCQCSATNLLPFSAYASSPPSLLPHSLISQPLHTNTSETNNFTLCICVVCNTRNKELSPNNCLVFLSHWMNFFLIVSAYTSCNVSGGAKVCRARKQSHHTGSSNSGWL